MPELISPDPRVHRSFLAAMAEFQAEDQGGPDDDSNTRQAIRKYARRWTDPAEFARYLRELEDEVRDESPRPDGRVPRPPCGGSAEMNTSAGYPSAAG